MTRNPPHPDTLARVLADELLIDNFAGGGGASTGIAAAFGRSVDVAVNHDEEAVAMHAINHPDTAHYCESVYKVDPEGICDGRPVGLAWFSPDCTHFSRARGGAPTSPRVRGLAWIVVKWAKRVRPRVLILENVEEFMEWGPLGEDGDPCPLRKGTTFRLWCNQLRGMGYALEHRILKACDFGAPTSRRRLFVIARCDGQPIVWPEPTHGPGRAHPYRTAAECIDWSVPCPSIFGRKRPLAENTLRRIAAGIRRYVLDASNPFVVPVTHSDDRAHRLDEPLRTITTARGGEFALVAPFIAPRYGERPTQAPRTHPMDAPIPTIVPDCNAARMVLAWLSQNNTGVVGHDLRKPMSTIVGKGSTQSPVTVTVEQRPDCTEEVYAFLTKYHRDGGQLADLKAPMPTIVTRDSLGLVTVQGTPYRIVDIGMRMLTPRELYRAQGFPDDYVIDFEHNGRPLPKASQTRMCGNSVPPPVAEAMVRANFAQQPAMARAA